ncbi:prenyltransferase [Candidatus Gracilibacteria bacterium]|nr:prenyltransferase [Candidatus Gracilibacteria bacterium]
MLIKQLTAFIAMSRPAILPSGVLAFAVGVAMAYAETQELPVAAVTVALTVTMLANLAAHFADEYADVDTDTLARHTLFSGGSGVLPAGVITPTHALYAAYSCVLLTAIVLLAALGVGLLAPLAGWIAVLGTIGGWYYSMPPLALERRGLGECDNALLGGVLMPLMGYVAVRGTAELSTVVLLLPMFAAVMICLLGVHRVDRHADALVGKRSLVVILGTHSRQLHHWCTTLAYGLPLLFSVWLVPMPVALALWCTSPLALYATWRYGHDETALPDIAVMVAYMGAWIAGWVFS